MVALKQRNRLKRITSTTMALGMVAVLAPVLVLVSLLILIMMGRPVFFLQERLGLNRKVFRIIKFRTMTLAAKDDLRCKASEITKLGKILRNLSLDELPQLFNIIKGDMVFVGPRPLPVVYNDYMTDEEHRRTDMYPGLTGLAQVSGRNRLTWAEKFQYDLIYIAEWHPALDLWICLRTTYVLVSTEYVQLNAHQTALALDEERSLAEASPVKKEA